MRARWLVAIALLACHAQAQEPRPGLQILVYGATGNIGTLIVDEALARGHFVTAVSRDPTRITRQHPNLAIEVIDGADTVYSGCAELPFVIAKKWFELITPA